MPVSRRRSRGEGALRQTGTGRQSAPVSGAGAVRADLEHHPRDPFAVDTDAVLDALKATWDDAYLIWHEDGSWCARPRTGPVVLLTCETPDELVRAMRGYGDPR